MKRRQRETKRGENDEWKRGEAGKMERKGRENKYSCCQYWEGRKRGGCLIGADCNPEKCLQFGLVCFTVPCFSPRLSYLLRREDTGFRAGLSYLPPPPSFKLCYCPSPRPGPPRDPQDQVSPSALGHLTAGCSKLVTHPPPPPPPAHPPLGPFPPLRK